MVRKEAIILLTFPLVTFQALHNVRNVHYHLSLELDTVDHHPSMKVNV